MVNEKFKHNTSKFVFIHFYIFTLCVYHISRFSRVGKPTLEYLCWTLEFQRRNSNVQRRYSNMGFLISAQIFGKFDDFSMHISRFPSLRIPRLDLEYPRWNTYVGHWNSYVGIPMSNIGIPTWVFQVQPGNSEGREPTSK